MSNLVERGWLSETFQLSRTEHAYLRGVAAGSRRQVARSRSADYIDVSNNEYLDNSCITVDEGGAVDGSPPVRTKVLLQVVDRVVRRLNDILVSLVNGGALPIDVLGKPAWHASAAGYIASTSVRLKQHIDFETITGVVSCDSALEVPADPSVDNQWRPVFREAKEAEKGCLAVFLG